MTFNKIFRLLTLFSLAVLLDGCVEPYEIQDGTFENALVVEATITDELKQQVISLSRTYRLEEDGPAPETGARVAVLDDAGNEFVFRETAPGEYLSVTEFQGQPGVLYQLEIQTQDNGNYISDPVPLIQGGQIDDLRAEEVTYQGELGVALQIDSRNNEAVSPFYKFEYEETFKIVSPFTSRMDLVVIDGQFVEVPKTKEEEICYRTDLSQEIILANTNSFGENSLDDFLVRFLDRGNPKLARRYSILVKQYALSAEAHSYYETLKKLSGSESLFSQNQPGFIPGNLYSQDNPEEKVIGYFNVSSVSKQRLFFDFEDFFDPLEGRPSLVECTVSNPSIGPPPARADNLKQLLKTGRVKYLGKTVPLSGDEGPYLVVDAVCVDCTLLGTNVAPDFWVE